MRKVLLLSAVTTCCLIASCTPGVSTSSITSATTGGPTATTSHASGNELTGFGATDAVWNAHHKEVLSEGSSDYDPGTTYGPVIPGSDGFHEWDAVSHAGGRIEAYEQVFRPNTSEAQAKQELLSELPSDVQTTLFQMVHDPAGHVCAMWNLQSATLASILGSAPWDDTSGAVGVELTTSSSNYGYNPSDVRYADVDRAPEDPAGSC